MAAGVLAVFDTLIIEDNLSFGKAAVREVQKWINTFLGFFYGSPYGVLTAGRMALCTGFMRRTVSGRRSCVSDNHCQNYRIEQDKYAPSQAPAGLAMDGAICAIKKCHHQFRRKNLYFSAPLNAALYGYDPMSFT